MTDLLRSYRNKVRKIPQSADLLWHRMAGRLIQIVNRPSSFLRLANVVVGKESIYRNLSDIDLRNRCSDLQSIFQMKRETKDVTLDALAVVREASRRIRGEHPYREQIAAALALLAGCVAELATGEGKTLSVTLAAILKGWHGRGCHVVTVNDYLARRDAETMAELYQFCGVRVAFIVEETTDDDRRIAYQADVLYATNKTLAADFLRDQVKREAGRGKSFAISNLATTDREGGNGDTTVMRGLYSAFVDEADSVLIDEAVTPLILSGAGRGNDQEDIFHKVRKLADRLVHGTDYHVIDRERDVVLTETGSNKLTAWFDSSEGALSGRRRILELVTQSLMAKHFYHRGKQYVVHDEKVVIVDEFTGRLMPDREWRDGLHQAVSAREKAEVTAPKETLARISFQRFFRMYSNLGGMTGTARSARRELWDIYTLPVVCLPTHRPCIREYPSAQIFATEAAKMDGIVRAVYAAHTTGRAVLIGTRSVHESRKLSQRLTDDGLVHELLNAEKHKEEAGIVSDAGKRGRITVATNMAGRGTDIRLEPYVKDVGGLLVILTERHESRRVDFQLFGRCARQGDPGTAVEIICVQDEIFRKHFGWLYRFILNKGELKKSNRLVVLLFFILSQWIVQRGSRITRHNLAKQDEALCDALGFAGREFF